jgi:hypothetical protein
VVLISEHLIQKQSDAMQIFKPDLHEDRAAVGEEVAGDGQAVAQISQIRMDAVAPGVAEGFDLLGLTGDVVLVSVLDVAAGRRPLEIRVEADAVGRVDIDALNLAAQRFALGEARHHRQAVAQNDAVRPVGVVPVELGHRLLVRQAVEIGEEVRHRRRLLLSPLSALPQEIVDQHLRVHLLLDVERRRLDDQVGPVLLVLAAPDELRVEIAVPPLILFADRRLLLLVHDRLELGRRDVAALVRVPQRLDRNIPAWHVLLFLIAGRMQCVLRDDRFAVSSG